MEAKLKSYIEQITGQSSIRQIATAIGLPQTTLNYQWRGNIQPSTLAAICRAYNAPILPAFVMAGYITEEDAASVSTVRDIKTATDEELAEEVLRRMSAGRNTVLEDPYGESNVTPVDFKRGADSDYGADLDKSKLVARKIGTPKLGADDSEE